MDSRLEDKLTLISAQIDKLKAAEFRFLQLEAHRKVLAAQLYLRAEGKNVAEREAHVYSSEAHVYSSEAHVYSSEDWINFSDGHVEAESMFNHERRRYELRLKSFDGEYLSLKTDTQGIKRQL